MSLNPDAVNAAVQELLTADKALTDSENKIAEVQQNHTLLLQSRDQVKAKLTSIINQ